MKTTALFMDLYELTMAQAFYRHGMSAEATFSLFIRKYPPNRAYFVSAGLEDVVSHLESFHFEQKDLDYLQGLGLFSEDFLAYLSTLRFTGDAHAMPEGRIFFRDEPVIEITAPIIEAQLVETFVINAVNLQVSIASKAARCVHAAQGRRLVDFSLRRTQGMEAGLKVARSAYIAGFAGTSTVRAGMLYGIPVSGTMAHSFVVSFEREEDAFRAFAETFPENTVLLIDTYDTVAGARKAIQVAKELSKRGRRIKGVRLDSGDMAGLSREVRKLFLEEGMEGMSIFASGGFDEFKIARVLKEGGDIDAFGVGTKMGVSADAPYTDMAYKLVCYDGRPVLKLSTGKRSLVGKKQVHRIFRDSKMVMDTIALRNEQIQGEGLLEEVMRKGRRVKEPESLQSMRARFQQDFSALAEDHKKLENPSLYTVEISPELKTFQEKAVHEVIQKELGES
jgi:nicotinate phosphoribosyltransferase